MSKRRKKIIVDEEGIEERKCEGGRTIRWNFDPL
jgi:hypothetical protein